MPAVPRAARGGTTTRSPSKKKPSVKTQAAVPAVRNPYADAEPTKKRAAFGVFRDEYLALQYDENQESFDRLLKKYGHSTTWVYIAVSTIASATAQIPIQIIKKDLEGQPNSIVRKFDRGLLALLERPNQYQSWSEFCEAISVSLSLTGNAFIEKVELMGDGRPEELYVLNPSRVTIVADPKGLRGYVYEVNGKQIGFTPDEISHIKYTHPYNDYYGLAPLTAARLTVETDRAALEWNRTFLLKGGWPGGSIETENDLDKDTVARLKREIKQSISTGKDSAGKILLLTSGLRYNPLSIKPKETDWLDARRMSRDEILAVYRVPFAVAGLFSTEQTTARSAGVEQQIKQFYRGTVVAHLKRILDSFNRDFVTAFSENFKLVPDLRNVPALADDVLTEKTRAEAARILIQAGFPINQVMARFYPEMNPVAWGDVAWMQETMVPIEGPENEFAEARAQAKKPTTSAPPKKTLFTSPEAQAAYNRLSERVNAIK